MCWSQFHFLRIAKEGGRMRNVKRREKEGVEGRREGVEKIINQQS